MKILRGMALAVVASAALMAASLANAAPGDYYYNHQGYTINVYSGWGADAYVMDTVPSGEGGIYLYGCRHKPYCKVEVHGDTGFVNGWEIGVDDRDEEGDY